MKHGFIGVALATAVIAAGAAIAEEPPATPPESAPASDDGFAGNVQFLVGQTWLSDYWEPLDEPMSFGVEADFAPKKSPVHVALGLHFGGQGETVSLPYFGDTGNVGAGFVELSAGFVWLPVKKSVARPYLGAGVVQMFAGIGAGSDLWDEGDGDASFGFYGNAGIFFKIGDSFNIGIDGRIVRGTDITIAGFDGDADYEQASLLFGFSWGE